MFITLFIRVLIQLFNIATDSFKTHYFKHEQEVLFVYKVSTFILIGIAVLIGVFIFYRIASYLIKLFLMPSIKSLKWKVLPSDNILFGSINYYNDRKSFHEENIKRNGNFFEFRILNYRVFSVSSPSDIEICQNTPESMLSIAAGFGLLTGEILDDVKKISPMPYSCASIIHSTLNTNKFVETKYPQIITDAVKHLKFLKVNSNNTNYTNPFKTFFPIAFQQIVRVLSTDAFAENFKTLQYMILHYDTKAIGFTNLLPLIPDIRKSLSSFYCLSFASTVHKELQARITDTKNFSDFLKGILGLNNLEMVQKIDVQVTALISSTGHTATVLVWALLYIHHNKEWRKRAIDGIIEVVATEFYNGKKDKVHLNRLFTDIQRLSVESLEKIHILEWIIKETIRMVIAVDIPQRVLKSGVVLSGHELPIGSFVVTNTHIIHHNEDIYEDSYTFNPQRWADGKILSEHKHCFLGFGYKNNTCPGQKLSKMAIKLTLALSLAMYDFEIIVDPKYSKLGNNILTPNYKTGYFAVYPLHQGLNLKFTELEVVE